MRKLTRHIVHVLVLTITSSALAAAEFSIENLLEVIKSKNLRSMERVIAELPREMRESNYVLMYRSRSLQEATFNAPRAILFSPTARFIVTFNSGDPKYAGHDTLETVQYREQTKSFEFREIVFQDGRRPMVSEPNPRKCLACHQSRHRQDIDPRPNWEPYFIWPGAYGSVDGKLEELTDLGNYQERFTKAFDVEELLKDVRYEKENVAKFFKNVAKTHSRYKNLGLFDSRLTAELTRLLSKLNFARVGRLARVEAEILATYLPVFAYLVPQNCTAASMKEIPAMKWNLNQRFSDPERRVLESRTHSTGDAVSVIFEPLGVDTSDWSMDFRTRGRFAFDDRFGTPGFPFYDFFSALSESDANVRSESDANFKFEIRDCKKMAADAGKRVATFLKSGKHLQLAARRTPRATNLSSVLRHCAQCHSTQVSSSIPAINFLDQESLREELRKSGYKRGTLLDEIVYRTSDLALHRERMPPTGDLDQSDLTLLRGYLESLK